MVQLGFYWGYKPIIAVIYITWSYTVYNGVIHGVINITPLSARKSMCFTGVISSYVSPTYSWLVGDPLCGSGKFSKKLGCPFPPQ